MPRLLPRTHQQATSVSRLCSAWHTSLPTAVHVSHQRRQLLRLRQADAVREESDASRRVALGHSRNLRACLRGQDGRNKVEAWGLLRLLVETEDVNEYHFSLVLQDGCDDTDAVKRLEALMAESGVKPNHVLSTGLHAAWVEHGQFERAVQVLADAHSDGRLRTEVATRISLATLSRMTRPSSSANISAEHDQARELGDLKQDIVAVTTPWDYLRELYAVGLAEPAHVAVMLRLCTSVDTIDLLLREMGAHAVTPDVHFYTALHNAWLHLGQMRDAVSAIENAREALSHDPTAEELLSRTRSNALRAMLTTTDALRTHRWHRWQHREENDQDIKSTEDGSAWFVSALTCEQGRKKAWEYFYELQLRGMADIFQYGVMAELACDSRQQLFDLFHRKTLIPHAATYTTLHHVWVRLGDMEEAVHQLRQGLVQGVLTRHAVDGLLSATLTALSREWPHDAYDTETFSSHRGQYRSRRKGRASKSTEIAWGWRVRPAVDYDDGAAAFGTTSSGSATSVGSGDGDAASKAGMALKNNTPTCRSWEYFTAAQRAATGRGMGEGLLGSSHYKLMVGLCRTADELRASGSNRQMRYAVEDDLGFAQCVHAAWINQFGDPAAAVAALKYVLVCNGLTHPVAVSGVDVPLGESVEKRSEYSGGMLSTVPCGEAIADQQASIQLEMQKRIARYNSSTLLRLLQQRAGVATAAGRAEASNYLQILSRHNLSDVYHYTIVLNACCKISEVDAILAAMADDGIEHTEATTRTLATVRRRLNV